MKYKDIILNHINIEKMKEELEQLGFKGTFNFSLYSNELECNVSKGIFEINSSNK